MTTIGIPKEIHPGEKRVAATPQTIIRLRKLGFEVLRVWNNDVTGNLAGVLEAIHAAVERRLENHPHPRPPLEGEGAKLC